MELTRDALMATVCILALTWLARRLAGRSLWTVPRGESWILIRGRGEGEELEQTLRELIRLRDLGLLQLPILIADTGLTGPGRERALGLAARWPCVTVWPAAHLEEWLVQE